MPTVRDQLIEMLSQKLGNASPFIPMLLNMDFFKEDLLNGLLGEEQLDRLVNTPALGPFGTMRNYYRGSQRSAILKAFTTDKYGVLSPMNRQYRDALTQLTGSAAMADSLVRSPVAQFALQMLDPLGINEAAPVMASAISTAGRMYGGLDNRNFVQSNIGYARAAYNLYTGKGGIMEQIRENPGAFGDLSYKQIMQVSAGIMSTEDPFSGVSDFSDERKVKAKVEQFSAKVKDMAKAIAPLKEVFGDDIPTLFKALEELSGTGTVLSDASKARRIVNDLQATLDVTGANKEQYMGALQVMQNNLGSFGNTRIVFGANALAKQYILSTANSNVLGLTGKEIQQGAAELQIGSAKAQFADDYNAALARYMVEGSGKGRSEAAFRAQVNALMDKGMSGTSALMQVLQSSGININSATELSIGRGYRQYLDYNERNVGGNLSKERGFRTVFDAAISTAERTNDMERANRLRAIRDQGFEAMAKFIGSRYSLDDKNQVQYAGDQRALFEQAGAVFGVQDQAKWQSYGQAAYRGEVLGRQQAARYQVVSALNKLQTAHGWQGVLEAVKKSKGADRTTLVNAIGGFMGVMDADKLRRGEIEGFLGNMFKGREDSEEAKEFGEIFHDALTHSATWSATKLQKFQAIAFKNGKLTTEGISDRIREFKIYSDLEPAEQRMRELYSTAGLSQETIEAKVKTLRTSYSAVFDDKALTREQKKKKLEDLRGDAIAMALLEGSEKTQGYEKLQDAISKETSGTGRGIYKYLDERLAEAKEKKDTAAVAQYEKAIELFKEKLVPSMGGYNQMDRIIDLIAPFFNFWNSQQNPKPKPPPQGI